MQRNFGNWGTRFELQKQDWDDWANAWVEMRESQLVCGPNTVMVEFVELKNTEGREGSFIVYVATPAWYMFLTDSFKSNFTRWKFSLSLTWQDFVGRHPRDIYTGKKARRRVLWQGRETKSGGLTEHSYKIVSSHVARQQHRTWIRRPDAILGVSLRRVHGSDTAYSGHHELLSQVDHLCQWGTDTLTFHFDLPSFIARDWYDQKGWTCMWYVLILRAPDPCRCPVCSSQKQ